MDLVVDVPHLFKPDEWIRDLRRRYEAQEESSVTDTAVFFDTFDGRLFDQKLACSSSLGILRVFSIANPSAKAAVAVEPLPRFAADLPEGTLKELLVPVAKDRALLKVLTTSTTRQGWRILNGDQKTVARIVLEHVVVSDEAQSAALGPLLTLMPVRGYEEIAEEMKEWFKEQGLSIPARSVYLQALDALHKTPKQNLVPAREALTPGMPAADAVRRLFASLYEIVRINEVGVRCDTDTEFLHDYRVAVRKARSLAGQTKGVFARGATARFRKSLAWLGKSTNVLRDLDVYLLHRGKYKELLGSSADQHIEPLFALLGRERAEAFQALVRIMRSPDYEIHLSGWGNCAEDPALLGLGSRGTAAIDRVARGRIAKKCRTVLERGYDLTQGTDPGTLHALRIECKELRYLMELFRDLVPEAKPLIRKMKKLQDNLGNIQDLTVQEDRLRRYLIEPEIRLASSTTVVVTKELIARVCEERTQEQTRLLDLFAGFNDSVAETQPPYSLLLPWLQRSR